MARAIRVSVCVLFALVASSTMAANTTVGDLRAEVERLRKELSQKESGGTPAVVSKVDAALSNKYGPNTPVTTKTGKLQIGGLLQVWYQHIDNDNIGIVVPAGGNNLGTAAENETLDNDTFRIRRTELRFTMDLTENITSYVMIDPARESNIQFVPIPTFPALNRRLTNEPLLQTGRGAQAGNTILPQLLQDAYINFHGYVPHHDFTIGQFKPPAGEEAWRNSGQLDFVERAMVTGINNVRDIGAMVHGTWIDNRVQYWFGVFNGPDNTVLADPEVVEGGNRSDDNDAKDFAWRIAVRPVWNPNCWHGRLELGYARTDGYRGESGQGFDPALAVNGLNRSQTAINRQGAWAWYRPGGPVRGWWLRGEWGSGHDRYAVAQGTQLLDLGGDVDSGQLNPAPVTVSGWYFSTGYRMSESRWADGLRGGNWCEKTLHDMEFAFRYETYQNIAAEDLVNPDRHTDQFKTEAWTMGLNYYIKGHDAKIQANYIIVDEPSDNNPNRGLREVTNNVFVVNFQVMF